MTCNHKWSMYEGFSESYEHCAACGLKKSDASYDYGVDRTPIEERLMSAITWFRTQIGKQATNCYISPRDYDELCTALGSKVVYGTKIEEVPTLMIAHTRVHAELYCADTQFYISDGTMIFVLPRA